MPNQATHRGYRSTRRCLPPVFVLAKIYFCFSDRSSAGAGNPELLDPTGLLKGYIQ